MAYARHHGVLFISSDPRPESDEIENYPDGGLFVWNKEDLDSSDRFPKKAPLPLPFRFHPHGIGILEYKDSIKVWVINHRSHRETSVEIFEFENGTLKHLKSIESESLANANDIAPLKDESFFVTIDHLSNNPWKKKLEDFSRIGLGSVLFYDGSTFRREVSRLRFANGIQTSTDESKVYVASMTGRSIGVYKHEPHTHHLNLIRDQFIGTAPDNLTLALDDKSLLVGAHPKLLQLSKHSHDHSKLAPAQILNAKLSDSDPLEITEIFLDDGSLISGASVAVKIEKHLILGSIFDSHLLKCSESASSNGLVQ